MPRNPVDNLLNVFTGMFIFPKGPFFFCQNYVLERLVELLNHDTRRLEFARELTVLRRERSERALVDGTVGLFEKFRIVQTDLEREHLANDWFQGWFPDQPVAGLMTFAIEQAVKQATVSSPPLRIECYWTVSSNKKVKFSLAESPVQITVALQTPPPAYERQAQLDDTIDRITTVEVIDGQIVASPVRRLSLVGNDAKLRKGIPLLLTRARRLFPE